MLCPVSTKWQTIAMKILPLPPVFSHLWTCSPILCDQTILKRRLFTHLGIFTWSQTMTHKWYASIFSKHFHSMCIFCLLYMSSCKSTYWSQIFSVLYLFEIFLNMYFLQICIFLKSMTNQRERTQPCIRSRSRYCQTRIPLQVGHRRLTNDKRTGIKKDWWLIDELSID